jgi:hypothetical protein
MTLSLCQQLISRHVSFYTCCVDQMSIGQMFCDQKIRNLNHNVWSAQLWPCHFVNSWLVTTYLFIHCVLTKCLSDKCFMNQNMSKTSVWMFGQHNYDLVTLLTADWLQSLFLCIVCWSNVCRTNVLKLKDMKPFY